MCGIALRTHNIVPTLQKLTKLKNKGTAPYDQRDVGKKELKCIIY